MFFKIKNMEGIKSEIFCLGIRDGDENTFEEWIFEYSRYCWLY